MTLDYIRIDRPILKMQISDKAKMLLGLIHSFNNNGLMMSNIEISKLLNCSPDYITRLLKEIAAYVRIENPQSRYRKIFYSGQDNGVEPSYSDQKAGVKDSTPAYRTATPDFSPTYSDQKCGHNLKNKRTKESVTTTHTKTLCDDTFQRFWEAYPRKENKAAAQREWRKLKPDAGLVEKIIEAVKRRSQTPDWLKDNGKYIPQGVKYLKDRRWEDELPEPRRGEPGWLPDEAEVDVILAETPQGAA